MPQIQYIDKNFSQQSLAIIAKARAVCEAYRQQGYDLTLRQLYYQFVSRDWIANKDSEYKRLGGVINDARLAGLLDWGYIVDRTRNLKSLPHWNDPAELVDAAAKQFRIDKWAEQDYRVEVWIEKDALVGVLQAACPELDVPYFSCRGYTSQSEIWGAAQRLGEYIDDGKNVVVLHLGDHDPSGIDMTRDIERRLMMFIAQDRFGAMPGLETEEYYDYVNEDPDFPRLSVDRIALNKDQIRRYNPPPNPAKLTDVRARGYIAKHGPSSWELDALEPSVLVALIQESVARYRNDAEWEDAVEHEESEREVLTAASQRWTDVKSFLLDDKEE